MIATYLKNQIGLFCNTSQIKPTPEIIMKLMTAFQGFDLIPSTFQEIVDISGPQVRLKLASPNNEWSINFSSQRIDIEQNPTSTNGDNLADLAAFCTRSKNFFNIILKEFPTCIGIRLAFITVCLLKEMGEEELQEKSSKLVKPFGIYNERTPFEWNYRVASKVTKQVENSEENLFFITAVNRVVGMMKDKSREIPIDRLQFMFDLNTDPSNLSMRFNESRIAAFIDGAQLWESDLKMSLISFLND